MHIEILEPTITMDTPVREIDSWMDFIVEESPLSYIYPLWLGGLFQLIFIDNIPCINPALVQKRLF